VIQNCDSSSKRAFERAMMYLHNKKKKRKNCQMENVRDIVSQT